MLYTQKTTQYSSTTQQNDNEDDFDGVVGHTEFGSIGFADSDLELSYDEGRCLLNVQAKNYIASM